MDVTTYRKVDNINHHSERDEIIIQFERLFKTIQTIKDTEIKIQLELGHLPVKQKAIPIPYPLQNYVEKEVNKLFKSGKLKKLQKVDEDCFASPVLITVKRQIS